VRRNGFGTQQLLKGRNRGRGREEQVRADVPPGIDHRYDLTLGVEDRTATQTVREGSADQAPLRGAVAVVL
jgi:hypothetical protein